MKSRISSWIPAPHFGQTSNPCPHGTHAMKWPHGINASWRGRVLQTTQRVKSSVVVAVDDSELLLLDGLSLNEELCFSDDCILYGVIGEMRFWSINIKAEIVRMINSQYSRLDHNSKSVNVIHLGLDLFVTYVYGTKSKYQLIRSIFHRCNL